MENKKEKTLDEKIYLSSVNKVTLLKKYVKKIDEKISLCNTILLYKIENTDLLFMQKDNEITFLNNNNDDMRKFIELMNKCNYYEILEVFYE